MENLDNLIKWFDLTFIPPAEDGVKVLRADVLPTIESTQKITFNFAQELAEAGIISRR
jgi:hypothetical protein